MATCTHCGHRAEPLLAPKKCPKCQQAYQAKQATAHTAHPAPAATAAPAGRKPWLVIGLAGAAIAAGGWWGLRAYEARERHLAELAHCGAPAWAAFQASATPALEDFERVVKATSLTARIALGPMLLRATEAHASLAKAPSPPPCGAQAWQQLVAAQGQRLQALQVFSDSAAAQTAREMLRAAEAAALTASADLAAAQARAVPP